MCCYSAMGDNFKDKWITEPFIKPYLPPLPLVDFPLDFLQKPTKEDIEKMKEEVKRVEEVLKWAHEYDKKNHQPECANEDKEKALQLIADIFGIKINFPRD